MSSLENNSLAAKQVSIGKVLGQTFASLMYPQVVLLLFLPILISGIAVLILLWLTWGFWLGIFSQGLVFVTPFWQTFLNSLPLFFVNLLQSLAPLLPILFLIALLALAFPIIVVLNLAMTSLLASTFLVHFIARRDFPELQRNGRVRTASALWNTIRSSVLFLVFWVLTFPLWLIPLAQLALPIFLTAWLNRQICTFDALTDFATDDEFSEIRQSTSGRAYALGLVTASFNYFPLALFFAPVLTMVAFMYMALGNLQIRREFPAA